MKVTKLIALMVIISTIASGACYGTAEYHPTSKRILTVFQ